MTPIPFSKLGKRSNGGDGVMDRQNIKKNLSYYDKRLILQNVPLDMTKAQIQQNLIEDFEDVNIYMPENTRKNQTKLVFMDFQKPWIAKAALRFINMINLKGITAEFARIGENEVAAMLPPLTDRRTLFPQGTFPQTGSCAYCTLPTASKVCDVCFTPYCATFYCHEDHQSRDWARHKFDCKPLPRLISPADAEAAIAEANEPRAKTKFIVPYGETFKKGDSIVIMNVQNDRVLYVRPAREDFNNLMSSIKVFAEKTQKLTEKPELNDTVLAPHKNELYRAQIVDVFEPNAVGNDLRCFLLDLGITRDYKWTVLKKLGYKYRATPRQTFKVILDGVKIEKNKEKALEILNKLQKEKVKLEVMRKEVRKDETFVVLKLNDEVINDELKQLDGEGDEGKPILFDESTKSKIPCGENKKLKVMDITHIDKGFISCMALEKQYVFWRKSNEINDYGNSRAPDEVYMPKMRNELCLVKMENKWERAAFIDSSDNSCEVILVDKLSFKTVPKNVIRKLPSHFCTEFFSELCFVDDSSEEFKSRIKPKSNVTVQIVEYDSENKWYNLKGIETEK